MIPSDAVFCKYCVHYNRGWCEATREVHVSYWDVTTHTREQCQYKNANNNCPDFKQPVGLWQKFCKWWGGQCA